MLDLPARQQILAEKIQKTWSAPDPEGKCERDGEEIKDLVLTVMAEGSRRAERTSSASTKRCLSAQTLARIHLPPHLAAGQGANTCLATWPCVGWGYHCTLRRASTTSSSWKRRRRHWRTLNLLGSSRQSTWGLKDTFFSLLNAPAISLACCSGPVCYIPRKSWCVLQNARSQSC